MASQAGMSKTFSIWRRSPQAGTNFACLRALPWSEVSIKLGFTRRLSAPAEGSGNTLRAPEKEPEFERQLSLASTGDQAVDIPEIGLRLRLKVIDWPDGQRDTKHEATAADWSRLAPPSWSGVRGPAILFSPGAFARSQVEAIIVRNANRPSMNGKVGQSSRVPAVGLGTRFPGRR